MLRAGVGAKERNRETDPGILPDPLGVVVEIAFEIGEDLAGVVPGHGSPQGIGEVVGGEDGPGQIDLLLASAHRHLQFALRAGRGVAGCEGQSLGAAGLDPQQVEAVAQFRRGCRLGPALFEGGDNGGKVVAAHGDLRPISGAIQQQLCPMFVTLVFFSGKDRIRFTAVRSGGKWCAERTLV